MKGYEDMLNRQMEDRVAQGDASGVMVDGDTYPVCDTCEYVDWDRRTKDGDECPQCAEATNG
jgi:hypothetical protein